MKFIFPRLYAFGIQSRWIHQRGKRAVQLIDSGGSHVHRCQNLNIIRTLSLLQDNLNDSLRHAADLLATAFYKRTVTGFFQKIRWNFAIYDTARQFNDWRTVALTVNMRQFFWRNLHAFKHIGKNSSRSDRRKLIFITAKDDLHAVRNTRKKHMHQFRIDHRWLVNNQQRPIQII